MVIHISVEEDKRLHWSILQIHVFGRFVDDDTEWSLDSAVLLQRSKKIQIFVYDRIDFTKEQKQCRTFAFPNCVIMIEFSENLRFR